MTLKGIRYKEVCVLKIGLMHIYYSIYFYYLLLFVIHVLALDKLVDLLKYLSLILMRCISVELFYICQTLGLLIRKGLPNQTTIDDTALCVGLTAIGSSYEI